MKNYLWYIWVVSVGYLVDKLKLIYYIIIYNYRYNARVVIYEHSNYKKEYIHNLRYKKAVKHNSVKYYLYLIFVWIWCDDNLNRDLLDTELTFSLFKKNISKNDRICVMKDLNIASSNKYTPFEHIEKGKNDIDVDLTSIWLTNNINKNNNFKWKYHYTTNKDLVFLKTIGKYKFGWELIEQRPYNVFIYKIVIGAK